MAARHLDCALGTLKSRLASGRDRLRRRLTRRGFAPAAATLTASLAARSALATVPARLSEATIAAAQRFLHGPASLATGVSASVSVLTEGVLRSMLALRLKIVGGILLAVVACATSLGVAVLAQPPADNKYDDQIRQLEARIQVLKDIRGTEKPRQKRCETD